MWRSGGPGGPPLFGPIFLDPSQIGGIKRLDDMDERVDNVAAVTVIEPVSYNG